MTVHEPQKLLDWVGHMINILVLTEKRHTWREEVLKKVSRLWEKPCVGIFGVERTKIPIQWFLP